MKEYSIELPINDKSYLKLTKESPFNEKVPSNYDWKRSKIQLIIQNKPFDTAMRGDVITVPIIVGNQDIKKMLVYLKDGIFTTLDSDNGKLATKLD